jgi:hypothetical protein
MTCHYGDPVEVRENDPGTEEPGPAEETAPGMFLWKGRIYQIKEVLAHWWERCPWWATNAAEQLPHVPVEREFWRVEAGPGRLSGSGIFDLSREMIDEDDLPTLARKSGPEGLARAGVPGGWRLQKVTD